ncbi:hypothetical protein M9H77_16533 [Catharanthus roseus]|uniref:Uncharacterized protein n=1 Tax=Catharanthus roseus TaxID=4058 RepID=A0ACC0B209_CATRO|nr:hypothetical protein M9H77_16533 [Catharanthus roseus]
MESNKSSNNTCSLNPVNSNNAGSLNPVNNNTVGSLNPFFPAYSPSTNGSGKTTFLRMLAGFSKPSAVEIQWNGHDIADSSIFHQYKLQLNWLSLKDAIKAKFTVLDNVQWFDSLLAKQGRSLPALELMGLGRLAKEKARMLSMGQRKKVQLARLFSN